MVPVDNPLTTDEPELLQMSPEQAEDTQLCVSLHHLQAFSCIPGTVTLRLRLQMLRMEHTGVTRIPLHSASRLASMHHARWSSDALRLEK